MTYLFELGRNPELSLAEIEQVFASEKISYKIIEQNKQNLVLDIKETEDILGIMKRLAGTVKISEQISEDLSIETLCEYIQKIQNSGKIQFSLSGNNAKNLALEVKKQLKSEGRSVRYIEANNTATVLHNNLVEKQGDFTLTKNGIFITRAIQDIEEWGQRDFGRPSRDSHSGMLPPKLARILINLTGATKKQTFLDPFCGSGTVITEAMDIGFTHLIGTDLSPKAIEDTNQNISWMKEKHEYLQNTKIDSKIFPCDVTQLGGQLAARSIDAIATEPYMGRPLRGKEPTHLIQKQTRELKELYISAFKTFQKIMKIDATIVFVIPRFLAEEKWIRIECLLEIQNCGFSLERLTPQSHYILYSRPNQFVAREIWKFRKI